jgi:hypothetical protein
MAEPSQINRLAPPREKEKRPGARQQWAASEPESRATSLATLPRWSASHRARELLQRLGTSYARITRAPQLDHVPARPLQVGIGERFGLIERPAVAVVARVEAVLGDKLRESHGFTRHSEKR